MKHGQRLISLVLALVMICGLTISASAATAQNITARLSPDVTVQYNGQAQNMADAKGNPVYPVSYQGTTYLPIRAVSNMLGIAVDWDQATKTVLLSDTDNPADYAKADPNAAKPAAANINVRLSPDVTVKYNGVTQTMKDATGTVVYPVSYQGTTYLPIRAVSNMLGVAVDWDQTTKTVLLGSSSTAVKGEDFTLFTSAGEITINTGDKEGAYKLLADAGFSKTEADAILAQVEFMASDTLDGFLTSDDAKVLDTNHIGYDYTEIDWSTANDGYVRIKINEFVTNQMFITVRWNENGSISNHNWVVTKDKYLTDNGWFNIPLSGGSAEYGVSVEPVWTKEDNNRTYYEQPLQARFTAKFDESVLLLMSHVKVDYEHAPLTTAKALELTKNCKTDAEKITAIFNYVANTVKYDYTLYNTENAREAAGESIPHVEGERDLMLDDILTSKTGVCEHYAVLMAGMLRSLGIPCKVVHGGVPKSDGGSEGHGWVSVSPDVTGLNKTALGAGTDEDGWIRLDPTWGSTASARADAANDEIHHAIDWY